MRSSCRLAIVVIVIGFLLSSVVSVLGQIGVPLNRSDQNLEPVQVRERVAQYCRADFAGARLNPAGWPKLQPVVWWKENPDYAGFAVVTRFDVDPSLATEHGKYVVVVRYRLLGSFSLAEGYSDESAGRIENVTFTVTEVNNEWRISDVQPADPHVSKASAMQWINQKVASTQDAATKSLYQHAVEVLQQQNASPFAK